MFHLRVFARQFRDIHDDTSAIFLNLGDESINEWNLCQMEHVLHSMDLSMEVSQSFWEIESAQCNISHRLPVRTDGRTNGLGGGGGIARAGARPVT